MDAHTSTRELPPGGVEDVPDVSAELYLDIVDAAESTPAWLQAFFALFTEASLILLLGLLLLTWWRARDRDARTMALALLAPVAMVVSYLTSEWAKTVVEVERPCRTLDVIPIVPCPPLGDWAFPSNHSTVAAAIAVGVLIARPKLGLASVPIGALAAYSRVFVGVHYPTDAVIGFLLGTFITTTLMLMFAGPITSVVTRLRRHRTIGMLLMSEATRNGFPDTDSVRSSPDEIVPPQNQRAE